MLHRHPLLSLVTGGYLCFVGWLTLTPQSSVSEFTLIGPRLLEALHRRGYAESIDHAELEFLANIGLFIPVGMFLLLFVGARLWWVAVLGCLAMTAGIEWTQQYIPGRVPDQRDLIANTMGGCIGVLVALVVTLPSTLRRARVRQARQRRRARVT